MKRALKGGNRMWRRGQGWESKRLCLNGLHGRRGRIGVEGVRLSGLVI